jgi:hypothetical protein
MSHREKEKEKEKEKKKDKSHSREKSKRKHSHSKEPSESKDKNESKSIKSKSHSHSKKKLKSSRSSSRPLSKRNSNKTALNDKDEKSYFSSMKVITSINNELELLNNDINSKFKNSNIFNRNYINNILFEKKDSLIDDYNFKDNNFYDNKLIEFKNSFNNTKIKKMENLYLYKQKYNSINNHMIYKQPDIQKRTLPISNRFKHNSFYKFKPKQNINRFKLRRNLFFPSISSFPLQQSKKFNLDNINLACKILLEED